MLLAVFHARCGLRFGMRDVHLAVTGGYRMAEPGGDLAAAAALASALLDKSFPADRCSSARSPCPGRFDRSAVSSRG